MDRRQLGAWAGLIGSTLFVTVFTIEGWLRPGYDPRSAFVSELALGPRGWIQIVNFVVSGALFLLFASGVAAEFRTGRASRAGPVLLAIIGISLIASGLFVTDPAGTPREQMSGHGRLHTFFGALVFSLAPVSCFVFFRRFRADPKWRWLQWWTFAAGLVTTASVLIMAIGPTQPPTAPNVFNEWIGIVQRTFLVTYFAWEFTVALGLRRQRARE